MPPSSAIVDHKLPYQTHNTYDVTFFGDSVFTTLTWDPTIVSQWISGVQAVYRRQIDAGHLIVGLDVEWRPSFQRHVTHPAATLQLCVGRRCLIFQLIHSPSVPPSLVSFLANPRHTFVGIGIAEDLKKLQKDYRFGFNTNPVDLRELAAERYGRRDLKNSGVKSLAALVLGKAVEKPKNVTMSRWDNPWLTPTQVRYACVDAFVCFEIGRVLNASSPSTVGAAVSARGIRDSNDSSASTVGYAVSDSNDSSASTVGPAVSARAVRDSNDSSPSTVGYAVAAWAV
ncbi:Werner Syndrome-like exonuclease [Salvia hispanica]|uniref:Werner Syndrome-like exonuclease n=1 Tax=Salvia hispanica TaxID=49212 RepID=UPI0020097BAE|nr:Werner Syndrome-like exonuclease [Salvia hispanica]